jgi:hypothetical protein
MRGCVLALVMLVACSRSGDETERGVRRGSAVLANTPAPAVMSAGKPAAASSPLDAGRPRPKIVEVEALKTEEPEVNPYSETVTLKLVVSPQVKALVLWGAKQMAHLEPGKMEAEITRPRGSGPLDLEIKTEGYLTHHTRLYADRDDKTSVRLYRAEEAPNLFGYNRSPDVKQAETEKTAKTEKPEKATKPK